ncbi:MAG: hypothetical protein J6K84_04185 [Oscillospiraceae bacterium]|nr:hypothetical protein [Oscillospiraceae bacterium]
MEHYPTAQERRVWERVAESLPADPSSPQPMPLPTPSLPAEPALPEDSALTPDVVMAYLSRAKTEARLYCYLAGKVSGQNRTILKHMEQMKLSQVRDLSSVYFILTGRKPCPIPSQPPCVTCINETLRWQYQQSLEEQAEFTALAEQGGEFSCLFARLAREACLQAEDILTLLGQLL